MNTEQRQTISARTPEEATLIQRLHIFVNMRWIAAAGVAVATLVATEGFGIRFSALPLYVIAGCIALYNGLLFLQAKSLEAETGETRFPEGQQYRAAHQLPATPIIVRARQFGNIHIALDLVALSLLLHFSGGIENPFLFYFVLHTILASIFLHYMVAYGVATVAISLLALVAGLEYAGIIPHVNLEGFAVPGLYKQETYILSVLASLASILYATAYMSTAISGELRKRQREVLDLRERELEEAKKLEEVNKRLVELNADKSRFVTVASHDLKAPLAAIQSYLDVMLGGFAGEVAERQRRMLERCSERVKELLNFISDLLDISRIERGFISQEMKPTALAQVVQEALESVRGMAEEKGIDICIEVPDTLPEIQAAPPRLHQVCLNLLSNAIIYTPEKGQIWLKVEDGEQCLRIHVMDTGMGIPSQDLPRIFEDFYRGSNVPRTEDRTKGAGLGLSIVKRIVEAHGGEIWAESPYPESPTGQGSKFTFTLSKNLSGIDKEEE